MGSFSWCYCDKEIRRNSGGSLDPTDGQRMRYGKPGHVLFPAEFGGKKAQIDVDSYEDYGRFYSKKSRKTYDIYELVADWNRKWIAEHPEWVRPSDIRHHGDEARPISERLWYPYYADLTLSRKEVLKKWRDAQEEAAGEYYRYVFAEYRSIGISIACYDDDNVALPYPIKIARNANAVYEECPASYGDPYQGF